MSTLADLHAAALASDDAHAWRAVYQAFAGSTLVVPITADMQLALDDSGPAPLARAFETPELYAATLAAPGNHAELPGQELARLLADNALALELVTEAGPILLAADQLRWIADTYGAEVAQATAQGVRVSAPAAPDGHVMEVLGQSVAALGPSCREAWLVALTEADGPPELVLVLDLADEARRLEQPLAETVTRAVQAVTDRPFAVACPDPDAPLLAQARQLGIGVSTAP